MFESAVSHYNILPIFGEMALIVWHDTFVIYNSTIIVYNGAIIGVIIVYISTIIFMYNYYL